MIGIVLLYPFNMFELSNYLSVWKLLVIVTANANKPFPTAATSH